MDYSDKISILSLALDCVFEKYFDLKMYVDKCESDEMRDVMESQMCSYARLYKLIKTELYNLEKHDSDRDGI